MRKNGSLNISLRQYKLADLSVFAILLAVAEVLTHFAAVWLPGAAYYTFSLMLPVAITVIMRWGWAGIIFAAADGALYCALNGGESINYLTIIIGNACISSVLVYVKLMGKEKIRGRWYFSLIMLAIGWTSINFGRSVVFAAAGGNFLDSLAANFGIGENGLLALGVGAVIICVLRRLDGMFEDQKHYILRLDEERRERERRDNFGDEPIEIDEVSLSILNRDYEN